MCEPHHHGGNGPEVNYMQQSSQVKPLQVAPQQQLSAWLSAATQQGLPLAVWRQPQDDTQHVVVSFEPNLTPVQPDLEEMGAGFLVHPFTTQEAGSGYFLPADLYWNTQQESPEWKPGTDSSVMEALAQLAKQAATQSAPVYHWAENPTAPTDQSEEVHFTDLVRKSVAAIEQEHFQKVVPSRTKRVTLPEDFQLLETFQRLCDTYPNAFVSLISVPGLGTWLGATPEVLLTVKDQRHFRTVALAGTQRWGHDQDIADAAWRQKEIEEQAMVSRYIINCFKKIRLREFEEIGPRTSRAGEMIHLKTDFKVDLDATNFPQLGTVMLRLLHPTSAVCGMPKEPAENFLIEHEGYARELYAGYLGPVNLQSFTSLYVNLRCMQWLGSEALLYAGAGVTADSKPEREWDETELKCNTMLSVISRQ